MASERPPFEPAERPAAEDPAAPAAERRSRAAERDRARGSRPAGEEPGVMIPTRRKRLPFEAALMRLVATTGIIGIGVAIGAIMVSQHSQGWLVGFVVSVVSVVLAAFLWSSRRL